MVAKKEEDLKNEAFQMARLKCHKKVRQFMACEKCTFLSRKWHVLDCF